MLLSLLKFQKHSKYVSASTICHSVMRITISPLQHWKLSTSQTSAIAWFVLAFILIFPTYLSYFLVPVGLKYLKTTVVAIYSYLILVVTTVVSLSLGQDRFSWTQAVAIAMICISVYFVEVAEGNSKKPDTPLPPQS